MKTPKRRTQRATSAKVKKKFKQSSTSGGSAKLAKPSRSRLRDRKESGEASGREEWLRLRCVAPITFSPIWEVVQDELRALGIVHHNKGIEAGMHLEILSAEFLAGLKAHEGVPEGWPDPYEKIQDEG